MAFRKVSAKEDKYNEMKDRNKNIYTNFEQFAEEETIKGGKAKTKSGKASSYARYLIYLVVLYEEIFNDKIDLLHTKLGAEKILKLTSTEGFTVYNRKEGHYPSSSINCYKKYLKSVYGFEFNHANESSIIEHISKYITSKGFNYSLANIKNLYLSLRSKPFVIISGISGTGKTKIVQLFAESIGATEDNGQFMLVPVRPDWSDGSELLGYKDIKGDFNEGPLTKLIRHAIDYPERPHFLLLDEMNLARVEYYFSDILSVMESRKLVDGKYTSSPLHVTDEIELHLPGNLYIIGTVNMDETTHPFSKKVLDRANTIEFNEIDLNSFTFLKQQPQIEPLYVANESLQANYIQLADMYESHEQLVQKISGQLAEVNEILKTIHAQVGYRVRDEICFYMAHNAEGEMLLSESEALDFCYMQKLLPRIAGSGERVETVLTELLAITEANAYRRSTEKLLEMLRRLRADEFTSFWIS